jgi:SH3 domain protein
MAIPRIAVESSNMTRLLTCLLLIAAAFPHAAYAEDLYIDTTQLIPLRSGAAVEHSVVHRGLPSGTPVTVIGEEVATGWSQVRTRENLEGWMPSRYLKRDPGVRFQVINSLRLLGQPDDGSVRLDDAITQLKGDIAAAHAERDAMQAQLAELRRVSANASALDRSNRQLGEQMQLLKNELQVVQADNQRLRDGQWQKWFIMGCWATGVGGLLTMIASRLAARRKRRSDW